MGAGEQPRVGAYPPYEQAAAAGNGSGNGSGGASTSYGGAYPAVPGAPLNVAPAAPYPTAAPAKVRRSCMARQLLQQGLAARMPAWPAAAP